MALPSASNLLILSFLGGLAVFCFQSLRTYSNVYDAATLQTKYGPWSMVVGASEGLGFAWSELLCRNGLNVVTIARREAELREKAEYLQGKYNCQVKPIVMDLGGSGDAVTSSFQTILEEHDVGLMIYNAAVFAKGNFAESLEMQLLAVKVNVESVTRAVHAFASTSAPQRNSSGLILMSSTLGEKGSAYVSTYSASKAYNTILAHGLANEFQDMNMDVLACVPGPIATPNFYRENGNKTSSVDFMIQPAEDVANECLHALGSGRYSLATGPIQKIFRFFVNRVLPHRIPVDAMSQELRKSLLN